MKKKCRVIMLPSNERASIALRFDTKLFVTNFPKSYNYKPQNLYITSDDEIKEGDWCMQMVTGRPIKAIQVNKSDLIHVEFYKKIIATTDPNLNQGWVRDNDPQRLNPDYVDITTMNGVPRITNEFIEKFVYEYNNENIIKEVNVEYTYKVGNQELTHGNSHITPSLKPKVDPNNFITITESKQYWTREEVVNLFGEFLNELSHRVDGRLISTEDYNKWIEENL